MKKTAVLVLSIVIVILFIGIRFNYFQRIAVQFDVNKYISYVENMKFESETVCINEPNISDLTPTDSESITAFLPMHKELADKYSLNTVANGESDFERALQLLEWLNSHTYYSGMTFLKVTDNSLDILEKSYDKPFNKAINCRWRAIAYADCLVAVGIDAYPVCMRSAKNNGVHFTCRAYIKELEKWCMFDPSFGCWFSDENDVPVDIFEMREMFMQGVEPVVHGYDFNGTQRAFDSYINGFLKNCISTLTTWNDNSMEKRDIKSIYFRKEFNSVIPG